MRRLMRRLRSDEQGAGMILVIGTSVMITSLVVTGVSIAVNGLSQSRHRQAYEQSLATAESGVDWTLGQVQAAFDEYNKDYPVPSPPSMVEPSPICNAPVRTYPPSNPDGVFATEEEERTWARGELESLATVAGCVQSTGEGDYVVLKPETPLVGGLYPKYGKVYALSWVPSITDPDATTRLVKSEYIFMPYRPTHAVLTGGSVELDSSTTVTAAYGVDPALASVHSNGEVSTNGNPTVTGAVTSTGTSSATSNNFDPALNPGGAVTTTSVQRLPKINAKSFYFQARSSDPHAIATWYDLCASGYVKPYSDLGPCQSSTTLGMADMSTAFLGWNYNATDREWIITRDAAPGTWFAHEANVSTKSGPDPHFANFTVIASAMDPTTCASKRYGNIHWTHHSIAAPAYHNVWMYADADLVTGSNFYAGSGTTSAPVISGMFVAGDQISLQTSSAGAVGSVVAADQCPTPAPLPVGLITTSSVKNPTIWYDPNSDAPFTSVINQMLWLDYSGG